MKIRLTTARIRQYDFAHEEDTSCLVRELEMTLDTSKLNIERGYIIQFWKDMDIYGLDEATTYLKNQFPDKDYTEFDKLAARIKRLVK